jgi:prophage antirepressor-like protein
MVKQIYFPLSHLLPALFYHGGRGQTTQVSEEGEQMNNIQIFKYENNDVRTVEMNGEPWFVGNDVAAALGYGKGKSLANAVTNHVDSEDKGVTELMTPGGKQNVG